MPDTDPSDRPRFSRRRLLRTSTSAVGVLGLGTASAAADDADDAGDASGACSETTFEPSIVHYDESIDETCADDHPVTKRLQREVRTSLAERYPTVGALIDAGYVPYLDFFADGDWAHWINPGFIGDDSMLDPARPESVLVDNEFWRPIGVMYVATENGDGVDPPPTLYTEDGDGGATAACTPWHAHVGFPGRYAWWKYRTATGSSEPFPCRTPWMLHVWIHSHPRSVYSHGAPAERGGPPAEPAGFETDADPTAESLGPEHLPDAVLDVLGDRR